MPPSRLPSRSVLTLGAPPAGVGAVLSSPECPPRFGMIDLHQVDALRAGLDGALAPRGLLVPGEDAALSAAERRIGRALAGLVDGPEMRDIASRLDGLAAAARSAGLPTDLLLDTRSPELWSLPWELLELLPQGEPMGGYRIARLVDGPRLTLEPGLGLEVLTWTPTPEDPVCARVIDALDRTLSRLPAVRRIHEVTPPETFRIIHVVSHGGERGEPVLELGSQRSLDAATLGRVLQPMLTGAALVVLDVCGADGESEPVALPAWRLVNAGAAACLAPRAALDVEASIAMSEALYGALCAGEPLMGAVTACRRAIAALGLPDPSARYWTLALVTADPGVLDLAPVPARTRDVPGLARAGPDAAAVLERAAEMAAAQGFFGLEHLALAMSRFTDPPPLLALAQQQLASFAARCAGFVATGLRGPELTPRLRALLDALPDGFDLVTLFRAMAVSRPLRVEAPGLSGLVRELGPLAHTLTGESAASLGSPSQTGLRLEVLGGPEDGLRCELDERRAVLGRWDPDGAQPDASLLFSGTGATDPAVSRRQLRWVGGSQVEALAPASLSRGAESRSLRGFVFLQPGDLLDLGQATRLEVLSVPA